MLLHKYFTGSKTTHSLGITIGTNGIKERSVRD